MSDGATDRIGQRVKAITADLKRYAEKRFELLVVTAGGQYAKWVANSTQKFVGFIFLFGALVFLLVALALYIGALIGSRSLGFVLVSIPLMVVGYLFINLKPRSISRKLKKEFEEELLSVIEANEKDAHEKLIDSNTEKSIKKKEYDE